MLMTEKKVSHGESMLSTFARNVILHAGTLFLQLYYDHEIVHQVLPGIH